MTSNLFFIIYLLSFNFPSFPVSSQKNQPRTRRIALQSLEVSSGSPGLAQSAHGEHGGRFSKCVVAFCIHEHSVCVCVCVCVCVRNILFIFFFFSSFIVLEDAIEECDSQEVLWVHPYVSTFHSILLIVIRFYSSIFLSFFFFRFLHSRPYSELAPRKLRQHYEYYDRRTPAPLHRP